MNDLSQRLRQRIALTGPMTIAEFMLEALTHPKDGYYATRDPLGAEGDFITAPEISQMFGELVGLMLAQAWMDQGQPDVFNLVELGPGRGTLMADALRATAKVPGFHEAAQICLVEVSGPLKAAQSAAIPLPVTHVEKIEDVPDGSVFLIANEFFDALPVRQFVKAGTGWRERVIGLADDALAFGLTEPAPVAGLLDLENVTAEGTMVTQSTASTAIAGEIGRRVAAFGGFALIIDYGDTTVEGDTLQAVQGHQKVPVLDAPGAADITAHVGFDDLATAARPAKATSVCPQGIWLERLGITPRAQALAQGLAGDALETHIAAHRRLTHPAEMGTLFKVMAIHPPNHAPPAGLFE